MGQIARNSKAGIVGLYIMIFLIIALLYDLFSSKEIILLILIHTCVVALRLYFAFKYEEISDTLEDTKHIKRWVHVFQFGSLLSGIVWGALLFMMDGFPTEYHFFVFSLLLGITAVGMSTLGTIISVYLFFMLPLLGATTLWMFLEEGRIYTYTIIAIIVGGSFYLLSVRKFAKNYKNAFIEEERSKFLKERMEMALDGSSTSILDWDMTDNTFYISPSWKELLGFGDEELENKVLTWRRRTHPDDKGVLFSSLKQHIHVQKEKFEHIHRLQHKDGHYLWTLGRARIFYNKEGSAVRMIGTHTDITVEKSLQLKYFEQAQIIEQTHDSVITTDFDGYISSWNHGARLLLEYTAEEAIGQHITMIYPQDDWEKVVRSMEILKKTGEYRAEISHLSKSGKIIYALISLSILKDENGDPIQLVGFIQDMTEYKQAQDRLLEQKDILNHQAHHDALTNLPNRILFNDRLEQAIYKAGREHMRFALLFLDLDHFKEINDSLGHDIGDEVLKVVTRRLHEVLRTSDTLARLGGDEFTIIMNDLKHGQDASVLAQKILSCFSKPILIDGNDFYVSCSIGISLYPSDGISTSNLLKYADAAMYKAKEEGRNNFQFYSADMTELAFERVVMETSLRNGIEKQEFLVYYQPQVDGTNNKLLGMEALVRWKHPEMGLVSPEKFIALAESTGLIIGLDHYVMYTAMRQTVQWHKKGLDPGVLALNLTMKQLQQKDFLDTLRHMLEDTQCKPHWIELEISESYIMKDPERAINILTQINHLGIELAIDDFGTGYSSLSYLKKLPISKVKIDQLFIRDLPNDEEDVAITKAVIAIAKSLRLKVVAEGVETRAQKEFLLENDCTVLQGHYYSRAVPADVLEKILKYGW